MRTTLVFILIVAVLALALDQTEARRGRVGCSVKCWEKKQSCMLSCSGRGCGRKCQDKVAACIREDCGVSEHVDTFEEHAKYD